jgi:hypothetical protein
MDIVRGLAIFCEDIREERSGQDILIGIMSDNLAVQSTPAIIPKLGVYIRLYFDSSTKPEPVRATLLLPGNQTFELGEADSDLIKGALDTAKSQKNPLTGIILKGLFSPLPIVSEGSITAIVKIGEKEHVCGALNIVVIPTPDASASLPPS